MESTIKKALLMRSTLYKDLQSEVLSSLASVAETLGLDARGLASNFDKFMTVSRTDSNAVTIQDVEAFRREQSTAKPAKKQAANLFARQAWDDLDRDVMEDMQPNQKISPYLSKKVMPTPAQAQPTVSLGSGNFKERCSNGAVQSVLNEHLQVPAANTIQEGPVCTVQMLGDGVISEARFMMDRLVEKVAYLDRRVGAFEKVVEEVCGEGVPHALATAAQKPTMFVGRVCCDTEDGRLNPQSVVLEGSTATSHGARVRVDLSACSDYRLFPGQVAVIKGTNPSGFCIVASEVLSGLPLPAQPLPAQQRNASYIVAAGPYTASEDLRYEPLAVLLEHAAAARPDVLLLAGPFVDAEHPLVREGMLLETFNEVFERGVVAQLEDFVGKVGGATRVLLVPSPRDIVHDPVFPQGPMSFMPAGDPLPNPCTFKCDDVVVGCSTADWLMACTKEEISASSKQVDRLPTLAAHILYQRSYFPMFPGPASLPLDTSRGAALELPCSPHVLVVPSDLAPFAKLVSVTEPNLASAGEGEQQQEGGVAGMAVEQKITAVVCINPGRLTKGTSAGTYAHVHVMAEEGITSQGIGARCRVEVKKL